MMFARVVNIIMLEWRSGLLADAIDASEKTMNLRFLIGNCYGLDGEAGFFEPLGLMEDLVGFNQVLRCFSFDLTLQEAQATRQVWSCVDRYELKASDPCSECMFLLGCDWIINT